MTDYETCTVRDLRRDWIPHKELLSKTYPDGSHTAIRFHRACSWLAEVEKLVSAETGEVKDIDKALIYQWIAFNALYGQWNEDENIPKKDISSWRDFNTKIVKLDADDLFKQVLLENREQVEAIFNNQFLSNYFWRDPTELTARQSRKDFYSSHTWYLEENWTSILDQLVRRIYLQRCQLIHGAATYNSGENRDSVALCTEMLDHIVRASMLVYVRYGAYKEWGTMCYAPVK